MTGFYMSFLKPRWIRGSVKGIMELGHLLAIPVTVTTHHSPFQLGVQGSHLPGGFFQFSYQLVPLAV